MTNLHELRSAETDHTKAHRVEIGNIAGSGEVAHHLDIDVGRVYATTTGRVVLQSTLGPLVMTEDECLELERALALGRRTIDKWERHKRREDVRQIVIVNGVATMRYDGHEMVLRKQRTRVEHHCDECGYPVGDESWVNIRTRLNNGYVLRLARWRICCSCFPRLIVDQARKVEAVRCP
jgi:hypothetical protein